MAITRSSRNQVQLEDLPKVTKLKSTPKASSKPSSSKESKATKRKAPSESNQQPHPPTKKSKLSAPKKSKPSPSTKRQEQHPTSPSAAGKSIIINRSPVLHLWSACVSYFLHPDLSWNASLNIGSAISSLCAVSKGKAIGMIESKDKDDNEVAAKEEKKNKTKQGARVVEVMGFKLNLKGDAVILSGKEKEVKEANLIGKFGGKEGIEDVKRVMMESLETWRGREGELASKAFGMYEKFKPDVPKGERGWEGKGS